MITLKSGKDFDDAVKASNLKVERRDVIVAQLRSTQPLRLDELFSIWGEKPEDGGLAAAELKFAKSLVASEGSNETAADASAARPSAGATA